jgi:antitoxin component HigA of HigAB toxin-antitoxin module
MQSTEEIKNNEDLETIMKVVVNLLSTVKEYAPENALCIDIYVTLELFRTLSKSKAN